MSKNDGGAAFPRPWSSDSDPDYARYDPAQTGMTLRDWFASRAPVDPLVVAKDANKWMQHMDVGPVTEDMIFQEVARLSFKYADAMLAERSKP